jgi:acetyl-CoA carboxylase biotin carboxyl carrier protein
MSTNDQNEGRGGGQGQAAATAPQQQSEGGAERGGERHGRGRRRGRQPSRQPHTQGQPPRRGGGESSLNMEELRELTELFSEHGLTDFEFENADIRIRLSRNPAPAPAAGFDAAGGFRAAVPHAVAQAAMPPPTAAPAPTPVAPAPAAESEPQPAAEDLHIITSPIPGTFYRSPAPNADPFVSVGSQVKRGQVVCIIEAMKLMNEIEADVDGTVEKIYVENGQPVEYGQPLFGIKQ